MKNIFKKRISREGIRSIFKKHIGLMLLGVLLSLAQRYASIKAQFLKGQLLDAAILKNAELLPELILKLLLALVLGGALLYFFALTNRIFIEGCTKSLREKFFKALLKRSYRDFFRLNQGETIAKYSKEIGAVSADCFSLVGILTQMTLQLIFASAALIYLNPFLALISLAVLSLPVFVPRLFQKRTNRAAKERLESSERNISNLNGILNSFEIIKNFGIERNLYKNFEKSNEELLNSENRFERAHALTVGMSFAVSLGAQAAIMILSAFYVYRGHLKIGDFLTIAGLIASLRVPLYWISSLFQRLISTRPTRKSVFDFINEGGAERPCKEERQRQGENVYPALNEGPNREKSPEEQGQEGAEENGAALQIEGLCYGYENDSDILSEVNLRLEMNKKYLLQGDSGSGKSTLIKLILNYYEPRAGKILLFKKPLGEIDKLEDMITLSRQEASLFSGSLRDNLSMFSSAYSDEELAKILNSVGLSRLLAEGLDYPIDENGANLSGGEKKRLSLARALIRKTPILILDEPFANIDKENMERIENAIFGIKNRLLIIISHQISESLKENVDQILRLEGGKINVSADI